MKFRLYAVLLVSCLAAGSVAAGEPSRDKILDGYAAQARQAAPGFSGFSVERGRALYVGPHTGGNPETNACAVCHTPTMTSPSSRRRKPTSAKKVSGALTDGLATMLQASPWS